MPETLLLRLLLKSLHPSGCAGDPSFMSETLPDKIKTLPDYFESWWSTLRELMISDFFSFLVTIPVLRHILTSLRLFLMYLISLLYLVFQGCCQKKKKKFHKLGVLKQQKVSIIPSQFRSPEVWNQGIIRTDSFWRFWGGICSMSFQASFGCWHFLAFLDLWTYHSNLCLHLQRAFTSLCVFTRPPIRTAIIECRAHLNPVWPHLY